MRGNEGKVRFECYIVLIAILTVIAVMISCEINPSQDSNDIIFNKISPTWTQEEAVNKVKLALMQLSTQSQTLRSQYNEWETQLRSEIIGNTDYDKIKQLNFSIAVQRIEANLSNNYQGYYVDTIKRYAVTCFDELAEAISVLIEDQNNIDLFKAQAEAYHMAHYINQREYYTSEAEKNTIKAYLASLLVEVERLGGQRIPQDSITNTIFILKFNFETSIPRNCGENRTGFIQQLEDYAQFDGWTDDLRTLGYNLNNMPRSVSGGNIQAETRYPAYHTRIALPFLLVHPHHHSSS
jgi:hypothetical protein